MRTPKLLLLAAGTFLISALGAHAANTTIRIVAAQAFRQPVNAAISHILNPGFTTGYQGTDITVALQAIYTGTTINGNIPVTFKTSFGTSVNAINSLVNNITTNAYLADGDTGPNQTVLETGTVSDVALSGEFQATTRFPTPVMTDTIVGVGPYLWVRSAGAPGAANTQVLSVTTAILSTNATLTSTAGLVPGEIVSGNANIPDNTYIVTVVDGMNITLSQAATGSNTASTTFAYTGLNNVNDALARNLFTSGQIALSQFTGSSADKNTKVTILGRDEGASSREVLYAECGFGTFQPPFQYQLQVTSGVVSGSNPYPSQMVDGVTYDVGHSGYTTFKTLATALNTPNTTPSSFGYFIGYLDIPDAPAVNGGNNIMTWNGVPYSLQAVENGQYTYWSYFHWLYRPDFGTTSPTGKTVADLISKQIHDVDAVAGGAGILLSTMKVGRQVDGGDVTLGNPYP